MSITENYQERFQDCLAFHIRNTNSDGLRAIGFDCGYRSVSRSFDGSTLSSNSNRSQPSPTSQISQGGDQSIISKLSCDISFVNQSLLTPGCRVCQLQFKHVYRDYVVPLTVWSNNLIDIGTFLIVESHINHFLIDLGIVTTIWTPEEYLDHKRCMGQSLDKEENFLGLALRVATKKECAKLPLKRANEIPTLHVARQIVQELGLYMDVYAVEYQFDGRILYIYYTAANRVDYRELVRQMVEACSDIRVKMKKTNLCRKFVAHPFATFALATGRLPSRDEPLM